MYALQSRRQAEGKSPTQSIFSACCIEDIADVSSLYRSRKGRQSATRSGIGINGRKLGSIWLRALGGVDGYYSAFKVTC